MSENIPNAAISARQVELAINRLDYLSTLPCVAAQYIPKIIKSQVQSSTISDVIESDPALTACIYSLLSSHGINTFGNRFSLGNAIDKLDTNEVREALLSIKVASVFDKDEQTPDRKGLLIHSLAVAFYAMMLAELISPKIDSQMAYFAGLLHDLGKFALLDIMPRSFHRMIEQARTEKKSSLIIEQQQIGTNHTLIGKRLVERWVLPDVITLAIWLHHSVTVEVLHEMPEAKIAAIVKLSDSLARQAETGNSGSFDKPEPVQALAAELGLDITQLQQLHQKVQGEVNKKSDLLGLEILDAPQKYLEAVQTAAVQFLKRDNELTEEAHKLQSASGDFNFIKDFLLSIKPGVSAIDIAENFAARWQKFYQTGKVCLYLLPPSGSQMIEVAVVENLSQSEIVLLNAPLDSPIIPKDITNRFAIINANDHIKWLVQGKS